MPDSDVLIAPCRKSDFPEVLTLLAQLWPGQPLDPSRLSVVFDRAIDSPSQLYLGARRGGALIGFGSLTIKNNLWQAGNLGHIDELVVDARHRGRQTGQRLLEMLIAEARARGCSRVELDSAFHREAAHAFYETRGFARRAWLFSMQL
jgi:GNAT superfamily N-acetyltransferase